LDLSEAFIRKYYILFAHPFSSELSNKFGLTEICCFLFLTEKLETKSQTRKQYALALEQKKH